VHLCSYIFSNARFLAIRKAGRGTHFDPILPDLFVSHFEEFKAVQLLCSAEATV
jgi:HD-GYP domain-containing protein (c-di-GMP phosphodiesterase class II)